MSPTQDRLFVTTSKSDMCYCPGCSHMTVLEAVGSALDRMKLRPQDVCMVSDIGCIGTADRYFACHTFHGLHGRSLTYAEGIKRARPELTVIVLIGDGGCGIGTAHLVHSARRGAGIKTFVCNNFNFGMTGGQHSPTTPPAAQTATTPGGNVERPFDICQTVAANGASHVARCSALDPELPQRVEAALRAPGFALLDVWELCTAYFVPANKCKPATLKDLSVRLNLPFGLLVDLPAADTTPPVSPAPERRRSPTFPPLPWPDRREILIAGSAGQRIRAAAGLLGEIAAACGLYATQLDDFPITVRKGFSVAELIVSNRPIEYTGVHAPDLVVIVSEDGRRRLGELTRRAPDAWVVADARLSIPEVSTGLIPIDVTGLERRAGKASAALAGLAIGMFARGWVDPATLASAVENLGGKYVADNLRAIEAAIDAHSGLEAPCSRPAGSRS